MSPPWGNDEQGVDTDKTKSHHTGRAAGGGESSPTIDEVKYKTRQIILSR
jgi:hypothetical protein